MIKKIIYDCFGGFDVDYQELLYIAEHGEPSSSCSYMDFYMFCDCGNEALRNAVFYQLYQMNEQVECIKNGMDYIWEDITVEEAAKRQEKIDVAGNKTSTCPI